MEDFTSFVEEESTQVRRVHDFIMDVKGNRTGPFVPDARALKEGEVFVKIKPGQTYTRTQVRRFLYEYYMKRSKLILRAHLNGNEKNWIIAKGVKDYIIMTGKLEFTYEEIEEMIESWAAINYV